MGQIKRDELWISVKTGMNGYQYSTWRSEQTPGDASSSVESALMTSKDFRFRREGSAASKAVLISELTALINQVFDTLSQGETTDNTNVDRLTTDP